MKKQILFLSILQCLLIYHAKAEVIASGDNCGDNCHWEYDDTTKTLTITGTGNINNYPKEENPSYNPNETTSSKWRTTAPWGIYSKEVQNINITSGITSLGEGVFRGMDQVTSVNLPNGLETIGTSAFDTALSLQNINIPQSVSSIGSRAFASTVNLESLAIPNSVVSIGTNAFNVNEELYGTSSTKSIVLGNGMETIGSGAFTGMSDDLTIFCPEHGNHGNKSCQQTLQKTGFKGQILSYSQIANNLYSVSQNGKTSYYSSLAKMAKNIEMKRIYTIDEANKVSGKKNTFKIRYK